MPTDTIERAIKRASGNAEGAALEEIGYEGYGPGGAAVLGAALTDNRNRAVAEIRSAFTRAGGAPGRGGAVGWALGRAGENRAGAGGEEPARTGPQAAH